MLSELSEEAGEPWEEQGAPRPRVGLGQEAWGFGASEGHAQQALVLRSMVSFLASPVFWAEQTVILPADFLVLLHPSVLQSVLGGRNHGAEL